MKHICKLVIISGLMSILHVWGQSTNVILDSTKMWKADITRVSDLLHSGVMIQKQRVRCWFPKDSLSPRAMDSISNLMNEGVLTAEKYINAPRTHQKFDIDNPIECFFPLDNFVSHADVNMGYLFIPFWRIKENKAPWLHEILHILLTSKNEYLYKDWVKVQSIYPTWLHEGFADYLTSQISREQHWAQYDVFSRSYNSNSDSLFLVFYKANKGIEVVPNIGKKGHPKVLEGDQRPEYAPIFYHGSAALVKYIANTYGIHVLMEAVFEPTKEHEIIKEKTGKSMKQIREEWRQIMDVDK